MICAPSGRMKARITGIKSSQPLIFMFAIPLICDEDITPIRKPTTTPIIELVMVTIINLRRSMPGMSKIRTASSAWTRGSAHPECFYRK